MNVPPLVGVLQLGRSVSSICAGADLMPSPVGAVLGSADDPIVVDEVPQDVVVDDSSITLLATGKTRA